MSAGLIEYLKAKKIRQETGKWPESNLPPPFTEAELKAILEKIAAMRDCA